MLKKHTLGVLVMAAAVAACAEPPTDSIATAEQADQGAVSAGAAEYAPDALSEVAAAKAAMQAELAAQNERWSVRRNYDRATELAAAYQAAAERARNEAVQAKEAARMAATNLITESRTLLTEVEAMLAAAPAGKGSRADLAAMRTDLESAAAGLTTAEESLTGERYLEAQTGAAAAREIIERVKSSIEQAGTLRRG